LRSFRSLFACHLVSHVSPSAAVEDFFFFETVRFLSSDFSKRVVLLYSSVLCSFGPIFFGNGAVYPSLVRSISIPYISNEESVLKLDNLRERLLKLCASD
jgi:hypothetical protein